MRTTLTLSSGCLTILSLRNLVGTKPVTPLSRRQRTPMAWPGQEPLSKWFHTYRGPKTPNRLDLPHDVTQSCLYPVHDVMQGCLCPLHNVMQGWLCPLHNVMQGWLCLIHNVLHGLLQYILLIMSWRAGYVLFIVDVLRNQLNSTNDDVYCSPLMQSLQLSLVTIAV